LPILAKLNIQPTETLLGKAKIKGKVFDARQDIAQQWHYASRQQATARQLSRSVLFASGSASVGS
jgi:hypothetical protein